MERLLWLMVPYALQPEGPGAATLKELSARKCVSKPAF